MYIELHFIRNICYIKIYASFLYMYSSSIINLSYSINPKIHAFTENYRYCIMSGNIIKNSTFLFCLQKGNIQHCTFKYVTE